MKILIDGDVLRYSCGFSAEIPIWTVVVHGESQPRATFRYKKELDEWVESVGLNKEEYTAVKDKEIQPVSHALHATKEKINYILLRTNATDYQIYLTGQGNFREEIATIVPYKGNRDSSNKPVHYDKITRYLIENWGAKVIDNIEADDALGITQWKDYSSKITKDGLKTALSTTICTIDKDLNMIPGWHYSWDKDILYFIDEETALMWFYSQLILGDKTDNIKGVPGCGVKAAYDALKDCDTEEDMFWSVLCLYEKKYDKPLEAMIENARLLWILRNENEMWNPPV